MIKKIIGILLCMLMMSTATIVAGIASEQKKVDDQLLTIDDDVPTWEIGNSWTYAGELFVNEEGVNLEINFNEASFGVIEDSGGSYKLIFGGDITMDFVIDEPPVEISTEDLDGAIYINKGTLGIEKIELFMSASVKVEGIPYTVPGDVEITITHQHTRNLIDFPIFVDKVWLVPSTTTLIDLEVTVFGFVKKTFNYETPNEERFAIVESLETVNVGSQTYEAYKIPYEGWLITYYAPSVGNFIKVSPIVDSFNFDLELIATSVQTPNSPLKPETPDGPTNGGRNTNYEYTTKAVDPNNDQIMYIWDWNGDMIPDEWTGYHDSDVDFSIEHMWEKMGNYVIRVKARDTNGLESEWSDPLTVTMPRNRLYLNLFFSRLMERFPNLFPLFRQKFGINIQ